MVKTFKIAVTRDGIGPEVIREGIKVQKRVAEVSRDYPNVQTYSYLVDAAAMFIVKDPKRFEVVVTSNLFGDILTDLGAALTGGLGLAAGANINPERNYQSSCRNWSASLMLEFLGYDAYATSIIDAIGSILSEKETLTPDLNGTFSTLEVGDRIVEIVGEKLMDMQST